MFKTSLLSIAVLLTLSSCGKDKEMKANTPAPAAPEAQTSPAPAPTTDPTKAPPTDSRQNPKRGTVAPPVDVPPEVEAPNNSDPTAQAPAGRGQGRGGMQDEQRTKSTGNSLTDIKFATQDSEKTGGVANDLYYTGAGSDGLMSAFKKRAVTVSADQQRLNANLAKAIVGARLSKGAGSEMWIDLAIDESIKGQGTVQNYRLKATAAGDKMNLSSAQAAGAGNLDFQGGFLKCLDTSGDCNNAYAKIKMSGAYTRVIFRKSYANTFYLIQQNMENNSGLMEMNSYIKNRQQNISTSQKLEAVQVASYEILNGRSAMGVAITTADKEMIGLNIPLLVSGDHSLVDTAVTKSSDISRSYPLESSAGYSTRLSQAISDVRLVGNTGVGQLKVKLTYGNGSIWMLLSKVSAATMSVQQVDAFEAGVKPF
jgi:hypothetical protein